MAGRGLWALLRTSLAKKIVHGLSHCQEFVQVLGLGRCPQEPLPAASFLGEERLWGRCQQDRRTSTKRGGPPGMGSGLQSIFLSAKSYSQVPFPCGCCGLQTGGWLDWPPLCLWPQHPGPGDPQRKGMLTSRLSWAGLLVQCRIQGRGP